MEIYDDIQKTLVETLIDKTLDEKDPAKANKLKDLSLELVVLNDYKPDKVDATKLKQFVLKAIEDADSTHIEDNQVAYQKLISHIPQSNRDDVMEALVVKQVDPQIFISLFSKSI